MSGTLLILIVVVVSYTIILAGATAYELTGLDRETARFQALSAFTGTGFTTRVSELVVRHPVRRRITGFLIIVGYAGTATTIASLLTSIDQENLTVTARNLGTIVVLVGLFWYMLGRMGHGLGDVMRRILAPRITGDRVPHEELLLYKRGYGITRIEVPLRSRVIGRRLRDLDLRARHVQVLAVEEGNDVHPIPDPDWCFAAGQHLIVYGNAKGVQGAFAPDDAAPAQAAS